MKEITQNEDRYSKVGENWVISASKDIKPLTLGVGIPLQNLKPVILANGIVVKVGDSYLCSLETLNEIKESNNPHYDIISNGSVKVKDKEVVIGKTVKIIELDVAKLDGLIQSRNFQNLQAGVTSVKYINNTEDTIEGIPTSLIKQINYTLTPSGERPSDEYSVVDYFKMVNPTINPSASHYTIKPIREITDQQETIFDPKKLQTFIIELDEQLRLLRKDFNTIKETFFNGILPSPNLSGVIVENRIARTDVDDTETDHSYKITESSLVSIESTPVKQLQDSLSDAQTKLQSEIKKNTESLQQRALGIEEALRRAQAGDVSTQQTLQQELNRTRKELAEIQKKLAK